MVQILYPMIRVIHTASFAMILAFLKFLTCLILVVYFLWISLYLEKHTL